MAGRQSYSIVEYYAEHEGYRCGYCKKSNTNFSHGMWAHSLTVHDYQSLIDRGWRRSGCYCYKPMMNQTCCPQYTIKCEALDFKISKSQKKILKRMTKFLKNELTKDNVRGTDEDQQDNIDISNEEALNYSKHLKRAQKDESQINILSVDDKVDERLSVNLVKTETQKNPTSVSNSSQAQLTTANSKNSLHVRNEIVNVVPCKKAKLLRIERKKNKLLAQGKSQSEIESIMRDKKQQNCIRTVEELFEEVYTGLKKLEMKLVRVMSDEFLNTLETSANLYKKYQMTIHGDTPEQCDQKAFYNFLVKSPLQQWIPDNGPSHGYGSFHEQYWLDNELVAVGVIDILPSCISSVYFFYDPTYSQLSLGTFSSLREIYLTRQLNKVASNLEYYYMGYYIHSCQKMRYKARMQPSKLLCPETYVWCNIEPCLAKLNNEKYCRLNDEINAIDENGVVDINEVLILYKNIAMPYEKYKTLRKTCHTTQEERREVEEYAKFIGMPCARRMLLYRYSRE
ncbi:PREDICTED: arginyl-tRNA--protein transferase 1 isoform X2 [Cyphomyrmex costatus]|uniref:arginyl-tRNA--protein transferase 1 isoform X2 n=1 Tax=Cyphomyrmex costatus TaxID=456900 RepID=UPI0008523A2D|nr:PREDICTED: arginyl-tRNA--protein transferase 1 isoform X2 [Cyphomyrmex costatus]